MSEPLVIGIGNTDRGDDGVGPLIASRLTQRCGARVIVRNGDALALIEDWVGAEAVILIDAAAMTTAPGRVHRLELAQQQSGDEALERLALSSTHALGVAEAVGLARALERLPERLIVYAVEGGSFEPGAPVSAEVLAAADLVADLVSAEVQRLRARVTGAGERA